MTPDDAIPTPAAPSPVASVPTLGAALARGTVGFTIVSLAGFSVWAFAGRWFYRTVGEAGLYAATTVVFIGLAGLLLHPLLGGARRVGRFYRMFVPAFVAYAVVWSGAWFALGSGLGEWLGSLAGSFVFAALTCRSLGSLRSAWRCGAVLFATHSLGYFLGGQLMAWLGSPAAADQFTGLSKAQLGLLAKLGWGLCYGLGFGAGLGFTCFRAQSEAATAPPTPTS